ncbi:hypothetical protein ACWF9G_22775 [Nocardia sp. NPDC055029]
MTSNTAQLAAETPAETSRVFDIARVGEVSATISRDGQTGAVIYRLTGRRISGALSVTVALPLRTPGPSWVEFGYGIGYGLHERTDAALWHERLTVNGVQLVGRQSEFRFDRMNEALAPERGWAKVRRIEKQSGRDEPASHVTTTRTLRVLRVVLADFAARDDLPQLHRFAAARRAAVELERAQARIDDLATQQADLRRAISEARSRAALLARISDPNGPRDPYRLLTGEF